MPTTASREQSEPDEAEIGQHLERHRVRLGHRRRVVTHAEAGDAEGPGARPGNGVVTGDLEGLAPPGETVVRAELREPSGVVLALSSVDLAGGPGDRVPDLCDEPDEPEERHRDSRDAKRTNDRIAPFGNEPLDRNRQREHDHDDAADDEENREQPPVVLAGSTADAVIDERAAGEGPGADRDSREAPRAGHVPLR